MNSVGEQGQPETFRSAHAQFHTWLGVSVGALLFVIFWMGTLSVFDREIDRWMMPETRLTYRGTHSIDALHKAVDRLGKGADRWTLTLPNERRPILVMRVIDTDRGIDLTHRLNPTTGELLPDPVTLGGRGFFFPFHFRLHLLFMDLGYWIVGFAAMAMVTMSMSGIIVHRRRFADFFMLRMGGQSLRTTRDLHTLVGVLGLPFNLIVASSGLIILMNSYFQTPISIVYQGEPARFEDELMSPSCARRKSGQAGSLTSLDAIVAKATAHWSGSPPRSLDIFHPGDSQGYVDVRPSREANISLVRDKLCFDAVTGDLLVHAEAIRPIQAVEQFLTGVHVVQYRHWPLRWLHFLSGLAGCTLIATGLLYWVQSRRRRHEKLGLKGAAFVNGLAGGATLGIILSSFAYLLANRILPSTMAYRAETEVCVFCLVWLGCFLHAWLRPRAFWRKQCLAIAVVAVGAVGLNAITTGDSIPEAVMRGQSSVAGVDILLLIAAAMALLAWHRLAPREHHEHQPPIESSHA